MKVSLIDYTGIGHLDPYFAARLLIFTKNTRLNMTAANFDEINKLDQQQIIEQLEYMANTIPSSWEFVHYTFAIEGVTRAFTHQAVRTRTASFAQQSMRVTDMSGFEYMTPGNLSNTTEANLRYASTMEDIQDGYEHLIRMGVAEEDARGVLPTNILTNIVGCYNLRTLSDLIKSREGGRTQEEYRYVVASMGAAVLKVHPWAELFLYPKGRDYWQELEIMAATLPKEKCNAMLKIIDKMRKQ